MELSEDDINQQEQVDQLLIETLQQRIPYAERDLADLAQDIHELIRSHAGLRRYIQRLNDRGVQARSNSVDAAALLDGKTRIQRRVRARKPWPGNIGAGRNVTSPAVLYEVHHKDSTHGLHGTNASDPSTTVHKTPQSAIKKDSARPKAKLKYAPEYHCILCDKPFASKGNCRKHIEDQHVSRKFQQCEGCNGIFPSVPTVLSHCKSCPRDASRSKITACREIKMDRRVYGSEFSGECFTTKREYVDHLLECSKRAKAMKPPSRLLWKFQALLRQSALDAELTGVLQNHFGLSVPLQDLEWDEDYMIGLIPILEQGVVEFEPGPPEALRRQTVRPFLESVISMSRCTNYIGSMQRKLAEIPGYEVVTVESCKNIQEVPWQNLQQAHQPWPLLQTMEGLRPQSEVRSSSFASLLSLGSNSFSHDLEGTVRTPNNNAPVAYPYCDLIAPTSETACPVKYEAGSQEISGSLSSSRSSKHCETAPELTQIEDNDHLLLGQPKLVLAPETSRTRSQPNVWLPENGDLSLHSVEFPVTYPYEFDSTLSFTQRPP